VTVLFADLSGYTALSNELDAEEVHALLDRFFEQTDRIIVEHGGHIDKHVGDCVMAVFGAPVAHGNDVERAVHAALAIRGAMPALSEQAGRALLVHVGIAGGQVVASATGSAGHREYTVTGESVNLAARLTATGAGGEILISEAVHAALGERLDCAPRGALAMKGFRAPVNAWRLLGVRAAAAPHPLVGRSGELQQFRAILGACSTTGRGQMVHVRGEAGMGKTRLVEEWAREAEAAGFACHVGLVLDFGAGTGRDAVRTIVRSLLGLGAGSEPSTVLAAAAAALDAGLVPRDTAVFLNDLLDLPQPAELRALYDAMDNATRLRGKRDTVVLLVERTSATRPRLIVVEDVHWADRLALDHLAGLAAAAARCPMVLVTTSRIEGDPLDRAWRAGLGGVPVSIVELGPLHETEARQLATPFLAGNAQLVELCIERAGGNPLFLDQLLRNAEEEAGAGVPGSVRSLVQARLDRLDAADRAALQAASVLGQRVDRETLSHLLGGAGHSCDRLVAHRLLRPQGQGFLFAHALTRDATYDGLLKARRRELHHRAAGWFRDRDAVLRAEHLERAGDPEAARAYLEAARAQARDYRYELAVRLVERGLAQARDATDRVGLGCLQGDLLHDLGLMPRALKAYEGALAAAADDASRCRAWVGRAAVKRVTDDLVGATADLERAERVASAPGLGSELARIHYLRGNLCFPTGDIAGCLREHGRSLELARAQGDAEQEAAALGGLGDAEYMRGRMISAHDRLQACIRLARQHGFGRIEVANLAQIAHTKTYFRPQREAVAAAREAAEAAARVGHQRAELNARLAGFFALFFRGEPAACREEVARTQALVRALGAWRFEISCLRHLGRCALLDGRREEAQGLLREAVEVGRRTGLAFEGPRTLSALALASDAPAERAAALAEGEAIIRAGCVGHNPLWFYPDAIEVSLGQGDLAEATRYAAALEDFTRPEPLPWADFHVAMGRALAAEGRGCRDAALGAELDRLIGEARRLELRLALPALERAGARCSSGAAPEASP
jgi:class 3 adenylate cyclase/tetratricopeptide (TPR) repeat protein